MTFTFMQLPAWNSILSSSSRIQLRGLQHLCQQLMTHTDASYKVSQRSLFQIRCILVIYHQFKKIKHSTYTKYLKYDVYAVYI